MSRIKTLYLDAPPLEFLEIHERTPLSDKKAAKELKTFIKALSEHTSQSAQASAKEFKPTRNAGEKDEALLLQLKAFRSSLKDTPS